eukprot:Skav235734  [mRNA]  locus=scaffold1686:115783:116076:- [translate_table: standard]
MVFSISLTFANPHYHAEADDPMAVFEFLVWHGFRLDGGDAQLRALDAVDRARCGLRGKGHGMFGHGPRKRQGNIRMIGWASGTNSNYEIVYCDGDGN